jgi:hypothetical protein
MKKKSVFLWSLVCLLSISLACNDCIRGEGEAVTVDLDLNPISAITLNSSLDINIAQGNEQKIEITAPRNIIDLINKKVKDGYWEINFEECVRVKDLQLTITVTHLESLRITGSGNIKSLNNLNFDQLALSIAGSGDMDLTINSRQVASSILGSGNINLRGSSLNHQIHIKGSGDIKAPDFETVNTKIEIIGSGDADIHATGQIEANITGSGDIKYKDTGARIISDVKGSGDIMKR